MALGNCCDWLKLLPAPRERALCDSNVEMILNTLVKSTEENDAPDHSKFLPTRLLDLRAMNTTDGIRLIETALLEDDFIKYTALSYCWGPREDAIHQLKTTPLSFENHLKDIPMSNLDRKSVV